MRDLPDADTGASHETETIAAPRGRAALGLSPKGMFYDWIMTPMKGRAWTVAAQATSVALTVFTGGVLVIAVYSLLS